LRKKKRNAAPSTIDKKGNNDTEKRKGCCKSDIFTPISAGPFADREEKAKKKGESTILDPRL